MAGRHRTHHHSDDFRGYRDDPRPVINRGPGPLSIHPAALVEELAMKHIEMQRVVADNRLVIDDNTLLQRKLSNAKDEIYRLGQVISKLRADKELESRELIDRVLKLEADVRAAEPLRVEVTQLRTEVQNLNALRQVLSTKIQGLTQDTTRLQAENQQLISMRTDIDGMRKELIETRRAYECKRIANKEHVEHKQAMEKTLISMAHEIEELREEQINAGRRKRSLGGRGYGVMTASPEMRYSGGSYGSDYSSDWGPYEK